MTAWIIDRNGRLDNGAYLLLFPSRVYTLNKVGTWALVCSGRRRDLIVRRWRVFRRW